MRSLHSLILMLGVSVRALTAQSVAAGDSALARGDTTAALAAFESATKRHLDDAEAHYRAGLIWMTRFVPGTEVSEPRRKAYEHFRYATRFQGDSAKYWVALADEMRSETEASVRVQVPSMLTKAVEVARAHPGTSGAALAQYRAGVMHFEQYETYANQMFSDVTFNDSAAMADPDYLPRIIAARGHMVRGSGEQYRILAEGELRGALESNRKYVAPAGLLAVLLGEEGRWAEAVDVGRRLVRYAPDSGRAWAVLGMAYARANNWGGAQSAFDSALAHMTPAQRSPYDNLGYILRQADAQRFASTASAGRAEVDRMYWDASQPLFFSNRNETRTEYFTRLTYVIHRWSDPMRGYQGYESDRGAVYVRYGPADMIATQRSGPDDASNEDLGRLSIIWLYATPPMRYRFSLNPGYARANFAGDFRELYRDAVNEQPVSFANVPAVKNLDTIDVQAVQFRGDTAGRTDVAVFGLVPLARMMKSAAHIDLNLQTGVVVKDSALHDVVRQGAEARVAGGDTVQMERRFWRLSLPPKSLLMHVEALVPVAEKAARGSQRLDVRAFTGDSLMMSDVVLAANIVPHDSTASRWTDFFINPSSGRLAPESPLGLLWEIYNLTPDSSHIVRYHVDLRVTVKSIERHGAFSIILGGIGDAIGVTARGDVAASVGYDRQANARPDRRQVEWVTMNLRDAPAAEYEVIVQVTDRATGRLVYQARRLVVTPTPLTR